MQMHKYIKCFVKTIQGEFFSYKCRRITYGCSKIFSINYKTIVTIEDYALATFSPANTG